jgi:DNA-binding transcriptional LysR family regulator
VNIQVRTETSPILTQQVLERRIEGAFVCDPINHPELVSETILDEDLVIFTALNIASLAELPHEDTRLIVLGQGSLYEQQLKAALACEGITTDKVMELGTLENIIGCVGVGLGVTLLPRAVIDVQPAHGTIRAHRVPGEDCRVQTLFIRRYDSFVSSALSAFLVNARNYAKALNLERSTPKKPDTI